MSWKCGLDPRATAQLLALGSVFGPASLHPDWEEVQLPWELWPPDPHPQSLSNQDARADRLWELLCGAVVRAVQGATSVRIPLSGGLDSRAVAAAAAQVCSDLGGRAPAFSAGTFGDEDCADLPCAAEVARALDLNHRVDVLDRDVSLLAEERVWWATDGRGGPGSAPGAPTDELWSECEVMLSGTSGDVVWGLSAAPGPSPASRLRRLGINRRSAQVHLPALPEAPEWVSSEGRQAFGNLLGRQRSVTWDGARSRMEWTRVVPIPWDSELLAFCLALGAEDRADRALLRCALTRRSPLVGTERIPLAPRRAVHDLDRAFREGPRWQEELARWVTEPGGCQRAFSSVGLSRRAVASMIRRHQSRRRDRAQFLGRVRALWRWGLLLEKV